MGVMWLWEWCSMVLRAGIVAALAALVLASALATGTSPALAGGQAGDFDLYVLSLSWSPDFCASHREDVTQCGADQHFGLVVHGLWPQFATPRQDPTSGKSTDWPANCPGTPASNAPAAAATVWPGPGLFRHEWQTHGTCSGLAIADYVDLTAQLRQRFQAPPALLPVDADRKVNAGELRAAILGANPDLTADGLALFCRKGRLAEIRLCLGRDGDHASIACPSTMSGEDNCPTNILVDGLSD